MPSRKILMGIPNYGYDWTLPYVQGTAARVVSNTGAVRKIYTPDLDGAPRFVRHEKGHLKSLQTCYRSAGFLYALFQVLGFLENEFACGKPGHAQAPQND